MSMNFAIAAAKMSMTAVNTYATSEAILSDSRYQQFISNYNADQLRKQADQAIQYGGSRSLKVMGRGRLFGGTQRAALAGSGVQLDSGTAQALQVHTQDMNELDALEVRRQANLEAHGMRVKAIEYSAAAKMQKSIGRMKSKMAIAGGMMNIGMIGLGAVQKEGE